MNVTLTPLDILIIAALIIALILVVEAILNRVSDRKRDDFIDRLRTDVEDGGLPLTTAQEVVKADVIATGKHRAGR